MYSPVFDFVRRCQIPKTKTSAHRRHVLSLFPTIVPYHSTLCPNTEQVGPSKLVCQTLAERDTCSTNETVTETFPSRAKHAALFSRGPSAAPTQMQMSKASL